MYILPLQIGTVPADLLAVDHCRAAEIVDVGDVVPFIVAGASVPWIEADLDVEWVASESKPAEFEHVIEAMKEGSNLLRIANADGIVKSGNSFTDFCHAARQRRCPSLCLCQHLKRLLPAGTVLHIHGLKDFALVACWAEIPVG